MTPIKNHTRHTNTQAWRFMGYLSLLFCLNSCSSVLTNNEQTTVPSITRDYRVMFEGRAIGQVFIETSQGEGILRTSKTTKIITQFRGMDSITNIIREIHEEDLSGNPLAIHKHIIIPNALRHIRAEVNKGELIIRDQKGDQHFHLQQSLPGNFLLHQGLRQKMQAAAIYAKPVVYSEWNFEQQELREITLEAKRENIPTAAWRIYKESLIDGKKSSEEYLVDDEFYPLRTQINYLGKPLIIERCPAPCPSEKLQPLRPLDQQLVDSPYQITNAALGGHIRYQITAKNRPPTTGEQRVRQDGNNWILDICKTCSDKTPQPADNPAQYLDATSWLEVHDKRLLSAVQKSLGPQDTDDIKMRKLTNLTRHRLAKTLQFSGYGSALQAYQSRAGDCTEYALLLAALGRTAGIPTRVLFGLSYSREQFHGHKHVFVPHAWVQAWVNNGWRSYDAALENFDAGHIALSISDGDQRDFNAMFEGFTQLKITSAQQIIKTKTH